MNNGCNRSAIIHRLHLVLSTVILCLFFVGTGLTASATPMSEIQGRGYLTIAVKDDLRPLGFRNANGDLQGLEIDLAKKLATDLLGKPDAVKLQPVANSDRLPLVMDHKVDLAIAEVTATESRARVVDFSVPYYLDSTAFVTKNAKINQLGDLVKRRIAVLNNSSTIAQIRYYIPTAKLVGVDSYSQGREQIENNTVDAFAADASVLTGMVQEYPQYQLLPTQLSAQPLSVAMPRGLQYDQLRQQVNGAIARYIAQGWLKQRIQYWGLP